MRIPLNEDENGSQNYVLTSLTLVMDMLIMNRSGVDDCPLCYMVAKGMIAVFSIKRLSGRRFS
jgi:hypothetical protein